MNQSPPMHTRSLLLSGGGMPVHPVSTPTLDFADCLESDFESAEAVAAPPLPAVAAVAVVAVASFGAADRFDSKVANKS